MVRMWRKKIEEVRPKRAEGGDEKKEKKWERLVLWEGVGRGRRGGEGGDEEKTRLSGDFGWCLLGGGGHLMCVEDW